MYIRTLHITYVHVCMMLQREARSHFGCDTLEGAQLENQGGAATARSHWEKRLFQVQNKFIHTVQCSMSITCIFLPQFFIFHMHAFMHMYMALCMSRTLC